MKKIKQPGDNFSLKTKKTEDPLVMQWINSQTNLMDSLRYLIENEIVRNGIRNLQAIIPTERNVLHAAPVLASNADRETAVEYAEITSQTDPCRAPELPSDDEIDDEDIAAWI